MQGGPGIYSDAQWPCFTYLTLLLQTSSRASKSSDGMSIPAAQVAGQAAAVQQYVEQGYIVRVLADVDTTVRVRVMYVLIEMTVRCCAKDVARAW